MDKNCNTCRYAEKILNERDSHCFSCYFRRGWKPQRAISTSLPVSKVAILKCICQLSPESMAVVRNQMNEDGKHGYLIIPECFEFIGFVDLKESDVCLLCGGAMIKDKTTEYAWLPPERGVFEYKHTCSKCGHWRIAP